jgi:transcription elongation factor GreA
LNPIAESPADGQITPIDAAHPIRIIYIFSAPAHRAASAVVRVLGYGKMRLPHRPGPFRTPSPRPGVFVMQIMSAQEKAALEKKREEMYKAKIDVQDRIRKAASLGDLSENAEYHFAKEENRSLERELAELEMKLRNVSVVSTDNVPENMVYLGHTVKLMDLYDDSEQLVRLVGEAQPVDPSSEVMPVSINSPMGEALMKARVGDTVKVKAPRGTNEFKILEIVQ